MDKIPYYRFSFTKLSMTNYKFKAIVTFHDNSKTKALLKVLF